MPEAKRTVPGAYPVLLLEAKRTVPGASLKQKGPSPVLLPTVLSRALIEAAR